MCLGWRMASAQTPAGGTRRLDGLLSSLSFGYALPNSGCRMPRELHSCSLQDVSHAAQKCGLHQLHCFSYCLMAKESASPRVFSARAWTKHSQDLFLRFLSTITATLLFCVLCSVLQTLRLPQSHLRSLRGPVESPLLQTSHLVAWSLWVAG